MTQVPHYGLLITKDDGELAAPWFRLNLRYFDGLACLDGSADSQTATVATRYSHVAYVQESDAKIVHLTDHGLRAAAYDLLVDRWGRVGWVTLCHLDEFFYHDPRKCCQRAEREGAEGIEWYALHFLPHPGDRADWDVRQQEAPHLRFRHYHWDYGGSGQPWREFRSFRNSERIAWDPTVHGSTSPLGRGGLASFHPAYRHYKVYAIEPGQYENVEKAAVRRRHWQGAEKGRTGVPWNVRSAEDLFVAHFEPYARCDHFAGVFEHAWNIGEDFR